MRRRLRPAGAPAGFGRGRGPSAAVDFGAGAGQHQPPPAGANQPVSPRRLVPTSPSILGGGLAGAKRSRRGRQRLAAGRFPSHRPRPRRPGLAVSRRRFRVTRRVSESRGVFPDFFESPATPRAPATHGRPRRLIRLGFDSDSTRAGPPAGSPGEALPGPSATGRRAPHPPRKLRLRPTEPPSQPPPSQTAPVLEPPSQPGDSEPPSDGQDRRWRRLSQL